MKNVENLYERINTVRGILFAKFTTYEELEELSSKDLMMKAEYKALFKVLDAILRDFYDIHFQDIGPSENKEVCEDNK